LEGQARSEGRGILRWETGWWSEQDDVYVGANAVVLRDVVNNSTVVGIPGKIARREGRRVPSVTLDHIHVPDPIAREIDNLNREIKRIEACIQAMGGNIQVSFLDEEKEAQETEEE
jgi:serine O-acetyltransferase